ncbi:MAG TPA: RDD family protein [Candidatus Angelobacter sp.]|nr:RDD family protein [Candidatus Angelobacter sp.]
MAVGLTPSPAGAVIQPATPGVPVYAALPYAGFWIRLLAFMIDRILLGIIFTPFTLVFMLPIMRSAIRGEMDEGPPDWVFTTLPLLILAAILLQWLYDALLTSSTWQATLGKRILKLKVTDMEGNRISFGRATGRFFGKILSGMMCNIGYIMAAFTERKQALHDMIAGTLVWKA